MKIIKLLFLTLLISIQMNGQINPWYTTTNIPLIIDFQPYGHMIEKDNSILTISGKSIREYSHYGGLLNLINLDDSNTNGLNFYFFFDELSTADTDYYLAAHRGGSTGNMYLYTYFKDGSIGTASFELDDNIAEEEIKTPAGISAGNGEYLFFGEEKIYKVAVNSPDDISIVWSKPNTGGPVATIAKTGNGYMTCSNDGTVNVYDEEVESLGSFNLGFTTTDIYALDDEYLICGNDDAFAKVVKIDITGDVMWENVYEEFDAYTITSTSSGDIWVSGRENTLAYRMIKTDADGNELWSKSEDTHWGINIMESQYGGIWHQTHGLFGAAIAYMTEAGDLGTQLAPFFSSRLDINNISTTASAIGNIFNDQDFNVGYRWPQGTNTGTIFAAGLWMSGRNANDELHTARMDYTSGSYLPGPFGATNTSFWNQIWGVSAEDIQRTITDLSDGTQQYPIPQDLLTWPALGNPNICFEGNEVSIDADLAPFEDVNNDGIYNIYDGDYPIIKGDKMLWWVMSDQAGNNDYVPFDMEIQGHLYAYNCEDELLFNTTFLDLIIQNKSDETYTDVRAALFTDFDLGCFVDDYTGVLPDVNSHYVYNEDAEDDLNCQFNIESFGDNPPIQSITSLNHDLASYMYINNGALNPPPPPGTTTPVTALEVNHYMHSAWRDGTPLTYGGDGYDPGSTEFTDYAFPGNPTDLNDWSMCQVNISLGDRRSVPASESFDFAPNETIELRYGMLTHDNINDMPCPDINQITGGINDLQNIFDSYMASGSPMGMALDLGPDLLLDSGEVVTLDAGVGGLSYEWSTGATTQTIDVDMAGTYWVNVTNGIGCMLTDTIVIDLSMVNTQELAVKPLRVYPNPTDSQLFIDLENEVPVTLTLHNIIGQQVAMFPTTSFAPNSTVSINMAQLSTGIYLLSGAYSDGTRSVQRVVLE